MYSDTLTNKQIWKVGFL